jgi:hypothetical protein
MVLSALTALRQYFSIGCDFFEPVYKKVATFLQWGRYSFDEGPRLICNPADHGAVPCYSTKHMTTKDIFYFTTVPVAIFITYKLCLELWCITYGLFYGS